MRLFLFLEEHTRTTTVSTASSPQYLRHEKPVTKLKPSTTLFTENEILKRQHEI